MNSTAEDRMTDGQSLDEPHFDEEATILAARPVVPLDEVKAEKRSKAGVAVALAIGGGILIGLLAATLIYRYLGADPVPLGETTSVAEQPASSAGEQTSNRLTGPSGGAIGDDSVETRVEDEKPDETDTETSEREPEESKPVRTQERAPEVAPQRPVVVRDSRPDEESDDEAEGAIRRAERQEERRERRRAAREARRQEQQPNQTADDLTRIREIFEGTPKP